MPKILALVGFAGAGKDTLANSLVQYGYEKVSFASILKDIVSIIFGWNRELVEGSTILSREWREQVDQWWSEKLNMPNLTPRWVLQHIGTDLFRKHFHEDIWTLCIERKISRMDKVVITDCRFPNEIQMIKKHGGKIIHVHRHSYPAWFYAFKQGLLSKPPENIHPSEYEWIQVDFDMEFANDEDGFDKLKEFSKVLVSEVDTNS